ncbi:MAG: PEP-CTERM sorting domain-containing protein, partial [Gammaproteobacteria bacterium]|nr:PEP-CTERM sorting domain-containing protein [Gammaproteobacteria bacterium]
DVYFAGVDDKGAFRFEGGNVSLEKNGVVLLTASAVTVLVDDLYREEQNSLGLDSANIWGFFDDLWINPDVDSEFLRSYAAMHGDEADNPYLYPVFSFLSQTNLAVQTSNFTQAYDETGTMMAAITTIERHYVPEPASLILFVTAVGLLVGVRKGSVGRVITAN